MQYALLSGSKRWGRIIEGEEPNGFMPSLNTSCLKVVIRFAQLRSALSKIK